MMQTISLVVTLIIGLGINANVLAKEVKKSEPLVAVVQDVQTIDINSASLEQLITLPGVGEKKAQAIIDYRQTHGRFDNMDALQQVKGIGTHIAAKLEGKIRF
ncbi:ComEA family DNA-binding protein [Pseudoalteromonas sp. S16_S37]|uniref:ComEA family DNA-binding protein n=1 Tax=Pseudoalteromonas sp. S16_S37 TaxID=2720228 RepID=UPI0016811CD2|nr:ComEA family DNA-binding protein [Pseudoalteromonas sp. S16_S37]MBD1582929.1 competence protein [Pseudoalteromonas sp. S16_S37]